MISVRLVAVFVALAACSDRGRPELSDDGGLRPRVFRPPPSRVRAVPPHNIHADGIGPYKLGASLGDILNLLPHGPRVELFRLASLADYSLVRSENGALLVGVRRNAGVTFVAAIEPVVARTEGGAEVGTRVAKLVEELGPSPADHNAVRDRRLVRAAGLPEALFWVEGGVVAAVVVDRVATRSKQEKPPEGVADGGVSITCGPVDKAVESDLLAAARLGTSAFVRTSCSGGEIRAAVVAWGDRWVWLAVNKGKVRRVTSGAIAGLVLAAPALVDDATVLVTVDERRSSGKLRVGLEVFRPEKQLVSIERSSLYELSNDNMRLAGGTVANAAIAVEVEIAEQVLIARGLYAHRRASGQLQVIAPLVPRRVELKNRGRRPARPAADAGTVRSRADAGRAIGPR